MRKHKIITIVCGLILFAGPAMFAQKDAADKAYENLGFKEAIELYRDGKLDLKSMQRMADGYRLNHDTQNAEKWYAQVVNDSDDPMNLLYYAQALHSNGKLEEAKTHYLKYDRAMGGSDQRGQNLANAIDRIASFDDNEKIQIELAKSINSPKLDFSPVYFQDGVVFVSNRSESKTNNGKDLWTGDDFNTHYFAEEKKDGSLEEPAIFSLQLDGKFHEGPLTFSKSGEEVYFTRNIAKKNKNKEYNLQIFTARQKGDEFGSVEKLDFGDGQSNDAHPALSPDGQTLYFASDREGGYGGMDIYQSVFSGGKWSTPVNLGSKINTPGNEVFPFIYDDGTLYFASDGWGGLGGLDVFYAEKMADKSWGRPENIGTPINSSKDDFSYILNSLGTEGYFTSAREGGAGKDDIYHFTLSEPQGNKNKKKKILSRICVFDKTTNERLSDVKVNVLTGTEDGTYQGFEDDFVVKLKPTEKEGEFIISLKQRDPFGSVDNVNETYVTGENGDFELEIEPGQEYIFIAKTEGYQESRYNFSHENLSDGEFCIPMTPAECVSLHGTVTNRRYGNVLPNATVTVIDLCSGETMTTRSDENGLYEFPCVACGCDFIVKGEKANFKPSSGIASTVGIECAVGSRVKQDLALFSAFDENGNPLPGDNPYAGQGSAPSNPGSGSWPPNSGDLLEEGLTLEIKDIYYDFDEHYIRNYDAAPDLDDLVNLMLRHPNLYVELESHTDCRGGDAYNMNLSDRRAKAARAYIIEQGVEPHRIRAKGYGETRLSNECDDGINCSEEEHQMNRRTEVTVFGQLR